MERISIGEVATVRSGFAFKSRDWLDAGVSVIKIGNVKAGWVTLDGCSFVSEEVAKEAAAFELCPGDVLISMTGHIGEVARVRSERRMLLNQRVGRFIVRDAARLNMEFLYYCLQEPELKASMAAHAYGVAQPNISPSLIEQQTIPLPPLSVQRRIAGTLSAYDKLIENNQRRIQILETMARALYREWFVEFRFPGYEEFARVASPLGDIPQGWEVKSIQQLGTVITGKTPSKGNLDFYGNDMPFVKTPDMHGNMFTLGTNDCLSTAGAESQANKTLPAGSICVSCIGTIGVVSITTEDCQTNQQINSVVVANSVSREFLFLRLQDAKQTLENLGANGATMGNVNKGKFKAMKIVCPPDNLLARYHRPVEPMFSEILSLFRRIQTLSQTRDLLLPRLLSGQVALTDTAA